MSAKFKEKLSKFAESAITWGAVGVLVGAIGPFIPPLWGFFVTFAFLVLALLKTNFFEGSSWARHIIGNILLSLMLGAGLFGVWRILPKPKEPPTLKEITDTFDEKMRNQRDQLTLPQPTSAKSATAEEIADLMIRKTLHRQLSKTQQDGLKSAFKSLDHNIPLSVREISKSNDSLQYGEQFRDVLASIDRPALRVIWEANVQPLPEGIVVTTLLPDGLAMRESALLIEKMRKLGIASSWSQSGFVPHPDGIELLIGVKPHYD